MSSLAQPEHESDFCPSCGSHSRLVESTGWCAKCTLEHDPEILACKTCGAFYPKTAQVSQCWDCRKEEWLTKHADEIEGYLAQGFNITTACKKVADDIRPTCYNCGEPIKGGKEGSRFCRKNAECEKKAISYSKLRRTGLSPDVALAIATQRVTVILSS